MKAVIHRLRRLETRFESAITAMQPPSPSPVPIVLERLERLGVVREPNESVAEMLGRALGWTQRELRAELMRRAGLGRTPTPAVQGRRK
jgi:hypothetical protein